MKMKWVEFPNSNLIRKAAYNYHTRELFIEFRKPKVTRAFQHVPKMFWYGLLESESAKRYFDREISEKFASREFGEKPLDKPERLRYAD